MLIELLNDNVDQEDKKWNYVLIVSSSRDGWLHGKQTPIFFVNKVLVRAFSLWMPNMKRLKQTPAGVK